MKFQLLNLIIWPKNSVFSPRVIKFEMGKVNVITGASRTGKSAIIPIIDYCLAASDCFIPIDTIRDHAAWYGVIFQTNEDQILIARKVPSGNKESDEFYLRRGSALSIPHKLNKANEKADGIKHILNALAGVPYVGLGSEDDTKNYGARLGFRDLMALIFQNQDIVANQNILFYKTHMHKHRERLRNWFPFILGAETVDILLARHELQRIEKRLILLGREMLKAKEITKNWTNNLRSNMAIAHEYGLLEEAITDITNETDLVNAVRNVLKNIPNFPNANVANIEQGSNVMLAFELEDAKFSDIIGVLKKRLNDINRLKNSFVDYGGSVIRRVDRLHISEWFAGIATETHQCPACGSDAHPNAILELEKVTAAFKKMEGEVKVTRQIPTSFAREEEKVKADLQTALMEKKEFQKRFDFFINKNKAEENEFQRRKNMYLFLGHLKASLETFEKFSDSGELQKEISTLESEQAKLNRMVDKLGVKRRVDSATAKISQGILRHLKTLDVEDKYRLIPPRFSVEDLNILVESDEGHWHILAEVGSASNWVAFHLALMCALQEFFLARQSCVPSFVIFDQPSQVYFPKVARNNATIADSNFHYKDDDVDAVKSMFITLSNSVMASNGAWQVIVLDHADNEIYDNIEGVHEVEVWRGSKKLIPEEWYRVRE